MEKKLRFRDIPQFTRSPGYRVNVSWDYLEHWIANHEHKESPESTIAQLDLDPDFQRGYVWTAEQKSRYVEYILKGGLSGRDLYFNCGGWMRNFKGPFVIVDGKQRLDAVRGFLRNEVPAFGYLRNDWEEDIGIVRADFVMHVNDLGTRAQVLQWYIDLNSGGTVHTTEELDRVVSLLKQERFK